MCMTLAAWSGRHLLEDGVEIRENMNCGLKVFQDFFQLFHIGKTDTEKAQQILT